MVLKLGTLGALGQFGTLDETIGDGVFGDGVFDCLCDDPKFRFEIREERRIRQPEQRKREGQKGETGQRGSVQQQ